MKPYITLVLVMMVVCAIVLVPVLNAQAKKDAKTGLDRLEGTITGVDKDKSTLTVRQRSGNSNVVWTIAWTADTKFTYRNEASTVDDLKDGRRVIVLGKFGEGSKMTAERIDVRSGK